MFLDTNTLMVLNLNMNIAGMLIMYIALVIMMDISLSSVVDKCALGFHYIHISDDRTSFHFILRIFPLKYTNNTFF